MNKVIKKQWVEALRSGNYEQGKGFLRKNNKFCCLGVLCELPEIKNGFINHISYDEHFDGFRYDMEAEFIPVKVQKRFFEVEEDATLTELVNMNDGGDSFEEIACYIDKEL